MRDLWKLIIMGGALCCSFGAHSMNEVRSYFSYTYPVDPGRTLMIADMNLSFALASTLVEWDTQKQISAGLAKSWEIVSPKVFRFTLRPNAKWSNGNPVTAAQVKNSLERVMRVFPEDTRSLRNLIQSIEVRSESDIDFVLTTNATTSGLLSKLTEANYGIVMVTPGDHLDLSQSTGAFALSHGTPKELTLVRNSHWHRGSNIGGADQVVIRESPKGMDSDTVLLSDPWPNVIETSSLLTSEVAARYTKEGYGIWRRPVDGLFRFALGKKRAGQDSVDLLKFLRAKLNMQTITVDLSGFELTAQMFPQGFQLYDPKFHNPEETPQLPKVFTQRPIDLLIPNTAANRVKTNIRNALKEATGIVPNIIEVPLADFGHDRSNREIDIFASTVGLADPDPEGAMSFYLEGANPNIQPWNNDFIQRLDLARHLTEDAKIEAMRSILSDAVTRGYILPLYHVSTVGLSRNNIDLTQIPSSDESVTFSKIRFRSMVTAIECSKGLSDENK